MSLEFVCPKCKCEELEIVQTDVTMTSKIVDLDEEGCFEYDLIDCDSGQVECHQCYKCGYILKNEKDEVITTNEEVVEWVKKNCKQDAGE